MVWIEAHGRASTRVRASKQAAFELVRDVAKSGPMFPGVEKVEPVGEGRFHWILVERRTLGTSFKGDYVNRYEDDGSSTMRFETVEGNVKNRGRWDVRGSDGNVEITLEITSEIDAPVPRVLKRPATLFAEMEMRNGLQTQLAQMKKALEA